MPHSSSGFELMYGYTSVVDGNRVGLGVMLADYIDNSTRVRHDTDWRVRDLYFEQRFVAQYRIVGDGTDMKRVLFFISARFLRLRLCAFGSHCSDSLLPTSIAFLLSRFFIGD